MGVDITTVPKPKIVDFMNLGHCVLLKSELQGVKVRFMFKCDYKFKHLSGNTGLLAGLKISYPFFAC